MINLIVNREILRLGNAHYLWMGAPPPRGITDAFQRFKDEWKNFFVEGGIIDTFDFSSLSRVIFEVDRLEN